MPSAAIRGPYCTGAVTPAGASALVASPQPHSSSIIWCSVVTAFTGGMSMTCRRSTAVTRRAGLPGAAPRQAGSAAPLDQDGPVSCIVAPGWPFGRPGLRPVFLRSDFGAGFARPSDDGGFEEFRSSRRPGRQVRDLRLKPSAPAPAASRPAPHPARPAAPAAARSQHEARSIIGNTGHLGHTPNYTTAGLQ